MKNIRSMTACMLACMFACTPRVPVLRLGVGTGTPSIVDRVFVEGGTFMMGTDRYRDEKPIHEVTVGSFWISRTEVTIAQYAECVRAGACRGEGPAALDVPCVEDPETMSDYPARCLTWEDAQAVAKWFGGRLPTEAEWEYVATQGGKQIEYPWGNEEPNCNIVVAELRYRIPCEFDGPARVCEVGSYGRTDGICDLAGNVWEWTQDVYYHTYDYVMEHGSPAEEGGPILMGDYYISEFAHYRHVLRGGGWGSAGVELRARGRRIGLSWCGTDIGARIVWDP